MSKGTNNSVIISIILMLSFNWSLAQDNTQNSVTFTQGDNLYKINKDTDSIVLDRKPFSIKYFGKQYDDKNEKFYAAQIAVLENPKDLSLLKIGQKTENISYYEPGTGMAPDKDDFYTMVFITNEGHHYLMYENEKEKRVNLISKNKDILELEWKISGAFYDDKDVTFSELKISTLYFVIFIDNNLNDIIDAGELKTIKVRFR